MDKDGASSRVGTILLITVTVALAAIVAILVSGLGGRGAPTITVWSSFENRNIDEKSYVLVNDELRIEFNNFSENSPIEYKIVLVHDGIVDNLDENQIYSTSGSTEIKCLNIGILQISANGICRAVEVFSSAEYNIAEKALHAQEDANRATWIATIVAILGLPFIIIGVVVGILNYRETKVPKSQKRF
jgi:preprotein translocase subunit SecG